MLKYFKIKYILLFVICIWEPFRIFILKIDAAGRSVGLLAFLTVVLNVANTDFIRSAFRAPVVFWTIWVVYAFFNTITLGLDPELPAFTFLIILSTPLMAIWVISSEKFRDRQILFDIITAGLYIRILIILFFETSRANDLFRLGKNIDSNAIGLSALVLIIFLYLRFLHKELSLRNLVILILIPFYIILATASRNAFGGFVILLAFHFYIYRSKNILRNLAVIFVGIILMAGTFYYIIENTYLGERLSSTTEQSADLIYYNKVRGTVFERLGDRGIFYVLGFELFRQHPVRGVGLRNFSNSLWYGKVAMHSEPMVQLSELGIIGALLYLLFYGWTARNLLPFRKYKIEERRVHEGYLVGLFIIVFNGLTIFQYNDPVTFMMTGAVIAYGLNIKESHKHKPDSNESSIQRIWQ